jgi:hypothetical protein
VADALELFCLIEVLQSVAYMHQLRLFLCSNLFISELGDIRCEYM